MATLYISDRKLKFINKAIVARWSDSNPEGFIDAWPAAFDHTREQLLVATTRGLTLAHTDFDNLVEWAEISHFEKNKELRLADGTSTRITLFHPEDNATLTALVERFAPGRVGPLGVATSPGLQLESPEDRAMANCVLVLCAGFDNDARRPQIAPSGAACVLNINANSVNIWTYPLPNRHEVFSIPRELVIDLDISGGELVTSGGGFMGGGFGLEGAAIGMAASALLNSLTTKTNENPVQLVITSTTGVVVLSTLAYGALELRGRLAPLFADVIANRGRIAVRVPTNRIEETPTGSDE